MVFPVVERIAPELSGGTEIVWRNSGNLKRMTFRIELIELFVCPDIGTVERYEKRNIADDLDVSFICIFFQFHPFTEEQELDEFIVFDLFFVFCLKSKTHLCGRSGHLVIPFLPGFSLMSIFTCHKYSIIAQPFFVFQTEIIELFQQEFVRCVMEGLESLFKQTVLVVQYGTVIDFRCIKLRDRIEIILCDQFQINQVIRADQQRLSGKGRKALIRRIAETGRSKRQNLP